MQWHVGPVHEGARAREDVVLAVLADVGRIALLAIEPTVRAALRTVDLRAAVAHLHHVLQTGFIIRKLALEVVERGHRYLLCPEYRR